MLKTCSDCRLDKPLEEFKSAKVTKRLVRCCQTCRDAAKARYHGRPIAKEKTRARSLWYNYGLTVEAYDQMLLDQEGKCKICNTEAVLVIDHCHETRRVRGLLCMKCNTGLGHFNDDPNLVRIALAYLDYQNIPKEGT